MQSAMTKRPSKGQKGFSIISLLLLLALAFAFLNVYSYFNPNFSLAKYTLVNILSNQRDAQRVKDLKTLEDAIVAFYNKNGQLPTNDGWCGRLSDILYPDFATQVKSFLPNFTLPHDPTYPNTSKDYFFYRVDRGRYILMAVMDTPPDQTSEHYVNFNLAKCHDWPGDDVFNYLVKNF